MMHWKFLLTLREVINEEWDYIFRTNTSSYVSKNRLIEFSKNLPKEKCYCGIDGGGFASGAGFFLSKDCARLTPLKVTIELREDPSLSFSDSTRIH